MKQTVVLVTQRRRTTYVVPHHLVAKCYLFFSTQHTTLWLCSMNVIPGAMIEILTIPGWRWAGTIVMSDRFSQVRLEVYPYRL